ncbi:hypothetical protein YIM73518_16040 [Thermus brockianus]
MMLEVIVLAHLRYLENVEKFLEGGEEPPLTPPTECSLGRWYHGEGEKVYGHLPAFREIGPLHEAFHALTAQAVSLKKEGREAEARERMNEAYRLFGRIEHLLLTLGQ